MVSVLVERNSGKTIKAFEVKGHSGYDEAGRDIVCAAVSAIAYTAAGALGELAGMPGCYTESPGYMRIELPNDIDDIKMPVIDTIMNMSYIGFRQIEGSYPEHLKVVEKSDAASKRENE